MYIICPYNSFLEERIVGTRKWFLLGHIRIKNPVAADQPENTVWAEKGKLDRASVAGSHHHHPSLHRTPGNKADPGPLFLGCDLILGSDPLWKDGPLWKAWDQQSQFGRPAGQGDPIQPCLCPTISWICAGEGKSGRKIQTHSIESKCQAREAKWITLGDALTAVWHFW